MKKYIGYLAITGSRDPLNESVLITDKEPPDTPYYKIEIRVLEHEKLFSHERLEEGENERIIV